MTQPTALFLADILEDGGKPADMAEKAANELRRLHAELERCKQVCAATSEAWRQEAALAEPQSTHSTECYQWHHKCAVAEVQRLRAEMEEIDSDGWRCGVYKMPDLPLAEPVQEPAWCEIHQHHKWCEHNGGVMGPTGWEKP